MTLAAGDPALTRFALQLFVVLVVARLLGELAGRAGFAPVVGELLTGLVLGPSLLGWVAPDVFAGLFPAGADDAVALDAVGTLGLLMLLVLAGLETDVGLVRRRLGATTTVAAGSIAVPFAGGFALGWFVPARFLADSGNRVVFALFLATALSISAVPVIARVLLDLGVLGDDAPQVLLAAALVNDALGWLLLSVVAGMAGRGAVDLVGAAVTVAALVLFLLGAVTVGQWLVDAVYARTKPGPPIGHFSTLVLLALGAAALAAELRIEAFLGAFVLGVLVGRTGRLDPHVRETFETVTIAVLAPVFFATAGLRADLTALVDPEVAVLALVTLAVAVGGKFLGAAAGARVAGFDRRDAFGMGAGLNARGALELVVASVGLSLGVLTGATYAVVVLVAVVTSVMAAPLLRWAFASGDGAAGGDGAGA
ncbi:cation:proton antiporter [Halobium salinum]|uniref:Cation:proton antiporter n=1 Tax=Halobium salinum TaxID=1364940 RepID=A0ABD5PB95_9EURY|nr:cation:proton antiporter [Halobium salinum]